MEYISLMNASVLISCIKYRSYRTKCARLQELNVQYDSFDQIDHSAKDIGEYENPHPEKRAL
jgi:hypothetical protein